MSILSHIKVLMKNGAFLINISLFRNWTHIGIFMLQASKISFMWYYQIITKFTNLYLRKNILESPLPSYKCYKSSLIFIESFLHT